MAISKKFFVDIDLQGNALKNATVGTNSGIGSTEGAFGYDSTSHRLQYFDGTATKDVANLTDIAAVTGGLILQGGYNAATGTPVITDGSALKGFFWVVTEAGTFLGESVQVGDSIIAKVDAAGTSLTDWLILQGNVVIATDSVDGIVRLATQTEVNTGTEGGAVVLTPATFENSQQLSDIRSDISSLETDKLSRDGSQAMTGNLNMGGYGINHVASIGFIDGLSNPIGVTSNLDLIGNSIANLSAPTNGGDAANKTYVDGAASTAQSNAEATAAADATTKANAAQAAAEAYADSLAPNYDAAGAAAQALTDANAYTDGQVATTLPLAGGTMSGNIDMSGQDIINVDNVATASLSGVVGGDISLQSNINANGNTISGPMLSSATLLTSLDAGNNVISNLSDPTSSQEAATKNYADNTAADAAAAKFFSSSHADTDWTLAGGVYSLTVSHNLGSSTPKVSAYVSDSLVEFGVIVVDGNTITLQSNIAAPASVNVGVAY